MRYPIIFLDLDGTLIGHSGEVADALWPALDGLRDDGTILSVCTGRPSGGIASEVARRIGPDAPHIFHGGAVARLGAGDVIDMRAMPQDALERLVEDARARDLALELYTPDAIFVDAMTEEHLVHARAIGVPGAQTDLLELVASGAPIAKAQWIVREADEVARIEAETPDALFAASATSDAAPGLYFVTVTARGTDKGSAVRAVCARLGHDPSACAAVGDSTGDLPMLEAVGHPFVMGNAPESLRERYPTLPHVQDDGVLELLGSD